MIFATIVAMCQYSRRVHFSAFCTVQCLGDVCYYRANMLHFFEQCVLKLVTLMCIRNFVEFRVDTLPVQIHLPLE